MLSTALAASAAACVAAAPAARWAGRSACFALAALLAVAAAAIATTEVGTVHVLEWMPSLGTGVALALRLDGLSLVFALLVTVVGALVLAYSARYLGEGRHTSFSVWMTLFAVAMLVLVLADDLVLLFVAWEATTLCSFFLIGRSGPAARQPAVRTLLVTAAGGLSLLAAVVVIAVGTGTMRLSEALASEAWADPAFASLAAVLVAVAAFTKSAQFPFHAWLPDSMVAITPVSAYLHAAAMVKAGIYLLLRVSPAVAGLEVWTALLVGAGLVTAILGAVTAIKQHDLKALLAYSTVSQLGLLVAMIGVGTPEALTAAIVHTIAHAAFKAALFMGVGSVDRRAGTRDLRELATMRLRMPATRAAIWVAAASMAGVPPLLGFVSKESMFDAMLAAPGPSWFGPAVAIAAAAAAAMTFAYAGRLALAVRPRRDGGAVVREGSIALWGPPALCAAAGIVLGLAPALLDGLVGGAATAAIGVPEAVHLALWHGWNLPLLLSAVVIALGVVAVLRRADVDAVLQRTRFPISALAVVDGLRAAIIRGGAWVGRWPGGVAPARHIAIPVVALVGLAGAALLWAPALPEQVADPSRPVDWVLVGLTLVGVVAAVRASTRIAAIVVVGIVGFTMTLWFFTLGAVDVAITQLLVEILTVTVMVLVLRRLPVAFARARARVRLSAGTIAILAGAATVLAVWALTGRRDLSPVAAYYLAEGEAETGGANIVNTILVDFRALDTLGELTVLGVAGVAIAALLANRRAAPTRSSSASTASPVADPDANSRFVRSVTRVVGPVIVAMSALLLLRGHQEPGGGFIAALVGGAGFALLYLRAPSDTAARPRLRPLPLIGAGILVGAGTGVVGIASGSYLAPVKLDLLGLEVTSALVFDVGVYLGVIGLMLAAFALLGGRRVPAHDSPATERTAS